MFKARTWDRDGTRCSTARMQDGSHGDGQKAKRKRKEEGQWRKKKRKRRKKKKKKKWVLEEVQKKKKKSGERVRAMHTGTAWAEKLLYPA